MSSTTKQWTPFFTGDYKRKTEHLTQQEHGAYLQLLMHCWTSGPLPIKKPKNNPDHNPGKTYGLLEPDFDRIYRIAGAFTEEEKLSTRNVVEQFFEMQEDGLHNKKADRVKESQESRSEMASENGKKGGRPKKNQNETQEKANENLNKSQTKANENLNHKLEESFQNQSQNQNQDPNQNHNQQPDAPERGQAAGCFFEISLRGQEMREDEWLYRSFLEGRRSKKLSVDGCHDLNSLLSLYPSNFDRYRRWVTQPIARRMAAFAYTALHSNADDMFKYALKALEEGESWERMPGYIRKADEDVKQNDLKVVIS